MNKLTLGINFIHDEKVKNYLLTLNGISKVNIIEGMTDEINITYEENLINIETIKTEIETYLNIKDSPSILYFDKHSPDETTSYELVIKNLCCEICLASIIQKMFLINGIESVHSDFDVLTKKDISIVVNYNNNLITEKEILKLEEEFNQ